MEKRPLQTIKSVMEIVAQEQAHRWVKHGWFVGDVQDAPVELHVQLFCVRQRRIPTSGREYGTI